MTDPKVSFGLNTNKAGMSNVDKEKINQIIYEASKGSKFFDNEIKKEANLKLQLKNFERVVAKITPKDEEKGRSEAEQIIQEINMERNLTHCIVHIDMDAFYAAAEIRDDPSLRNKPMAVGSTSMLSTSNYEARKFGVRAAMPGFIALKLCPELIIISPDFDKYTKMSRDFRRVFGEYDRNFVSMGLDEAYLDLTEHLKERFHYKPEQMKYQCHHLCRCKEKSCDESSNLFQVCTKCGNLIGSKVRQFENTLWSAVEELRFRVFVETRLTCSAGIAANSLLSKIASDFRKPNGQYQVPFNEEDIVAFMSQLPVRKVPGIGKVLERKLEHVGIRSCGEILEKSGIIYHLFKSATFHYFLRIGLGDGESELTHESGCQKKASADIQKSMSVERTFNDCDDAELLLKKCRELSQSLVDDMIDSRVKAKSVHIKLKLNTFEIKTRSQVMLQYTSDFNIISSAASELLATEIEVHQKKLCLRLLGVRVSNLVPVELVSKRRQWNLEMAFNKIVADQSKLSELNGEERLKVQEETPDSKFELKEDEENHGSTLLDCGDKENGNVSEAVEQLNEDVCNEGNNSVAAVSCPVCNKKVDSSRINVHLDSCLQSSSFNNTQVSRKRPSASVVGNNSKKSRLKDSTIDYFFKKL